MKLLNNDSLKRMTQWFSLVLNYFDAPSEMECYIMHTWLVNHSNNIMTDKSMLNINKTSHISLGTQITMLQCAIAGGRRKGAN